MRIYTRSGDKGVTSLIHGKRVAKNDIRVEAYGTCDEANSMIGFALSLLNDSDGWSDRAEFIQVMQRVQSTLFHVGSELATPKGKEVFWRLKEEHIDELEERIDQWDSELPDLKTFILPSGHPTSAALHSARTIVRRAERLAVSLIEDTEKSLVISYLNRLSDFLFVAARFVNQKCGGSEIPLTIEN